MTAEGAWALHTTASLDEVNVHLASFEQLGLLGMAEQSGATTVYLRDRAAQPPVEGTWERIEDRDWNAVWKAGFDPVVVGKVAVVAPWHDDVPATPITLVIEPAQAFGTGHHETTTACLAALQDLDLTGRSVFDVGTGTGVLAIAAKALGAADVLAVDIDPLAVEAAADNAMRNGYPIQVQEGSADAADGTYDVVVANIDTATVTALAAPLAAAVRDGGRFIGSGVSNERADEAVTALRSAGLSDVAATPGAEWVLLTATKEP